MRQKIAIKLFASTIFRSDGQTSNVARALTRPSWEKILKECSLAARRILMGRGRSAVFPSPPQSSIGMDRGDGNVMETTARRKCRSCLRHLSASKLKLGSQCSACALQTQQTKDCRVCHQTFSRSDFSMSQWNGRLKCKVCVSQIKIHNYNTRKLKKGGIDRVQKL